VHDICSKKQHLKSKHTQSRGTNFSNKHDKHPLPKAKYSTTQTRAVAPYERKCTKSNHDRFRLNFKMISAVQRTSVSCNCVSTFL